MLRFYALSALISLGYNVNLAHSTVYHSSQRKPNAILYIGYKQPRLAMCPTLHSVPNSPNTGRVLTEHKKRWETRRKRAHSPRARIILGLETESARGDEGG